MVNYAFFFMTSRKWTFMFLFPVVLNNIIMLIDCASAKAKLFQALEELYHIFYHFLLLSKTKRIDCFLLSRVFALNRRTKMRKEG